MHKENFYSAKIKHKSNNELQDYIDNKSRYHKDAILAAMWELERREATDSVTQEHIKAFELKSEETKHREFERDRISNLSNTGIPISTITWRPRLLHWTLDILIIEFIVWWLFQFLWLDFYNLIHLIVFVAYYAISEFYFQKTIGKYATGSVVIDINGNKPDQKTIFLRSISRLIPFEPLSCIGLFSRGWHDILTQTYVVKLEDLKEFKNGNDKKVE